MKHMQAGWMRCPAVVMWLLTAGMVVSAPQIHGIDAGAADADLFVCAMTGDDAAAGTDQSAPLRTVPAALERAEPGTVITLLPGRYPGGIVLRPGQPGRPLTLRGANRGRVVIGEPPVILSGWERVPGFDYTYVADTRLGLRNLMEASTGRQMRPMPSLTDVEQLAGTFYHDAPAGKLYLHPTDSESAARHLYVVPPSAGLGILLADHTVVEDLVITGMGDAAMRGNDPTNAVVRHCLAYGNGYAINLRGGRDCVISGNHFWGNVPQYGAGSQIYITKPRAMGIIVENNRVYDSSKSGIRFYNIGEAVENCVLHGNIFQGSHSKGVPRDAGIHAEHNVGLTTLWAHTGGHNTYRRSSRPEYIKSSDLLMGERDWYFADPAYMDFRLQADSPARGAAPDGSDLGAYPYLGDVLYVARDGDDAADGRSRLSAWRTLRWAAAQLEPGQTLYIEPGDWNEPLILEDLHAGQADPIRIRVRGRGRAVLPELRISHCVNLELEGLGLAGDAAVLEVRDAQKIVLRRCWVNRATPGSGIMVSASTNVTLEHCAVAGGGSGLLVERSLDVELVSSLLTAAGVQIELRGDTKGFWSEHNAFVPGHGGAPLAMAPGGVAANLEEWRTMLGLDLASHAASGADFIDPLQGDFQVRAGRPASYGGRYEKPVGPHGVRLPEESRQAIERVEVVSVTRTSANITYWTPGRVTGTMIEWGRTPEYGESYDRAGRARGEYETLHTVSLLGLEPETRYHFRVGFRDHQDDADQDAESARIDAAAEAPLVWSADFNFTTAAADPQPRRLYVATDGDDARDGLSPATAWRSLARAARAARAGDTVSIAPGRYLELLRPLQTGTSDEGRITFRAERPMTVFLDGGFAGDGTGRSHAVQLLSKSFITLENLVFENARNHDNGGYRGWPGYAGLVRVSGSTGIAIKGCVLEGRHRFMVGLVAEGLGAMPGSPADTPPLTVADNLFIGNWFAFYVGGRGPNRFHHNAIVRCRLLMAAFSAPTELRNNIYQSLGENKWGSNLFTGIDRMDSDYNCFGWDDQNEQRVVAWQGRNRQTRRAVRGLAEWQEVFGQDPHGIEAEPGYPLSAKLGFGGSGKVGPARPLSVSDLILPPDSPCRGAGENGVDIGPRWERFLD